MFFGIFSLFNGLFLSSETGCAFKGSIPRVKWPGIVLVRQRTTSLGKDVP
jgi:hypothetical protein